MNPRRPTPSGPQPDPFDQARAPPHPIWVLSEYPLYISCPRAINALFLTLRVSMCMLGARFE